MLITSFCLIAISGTILHIATHRVRVHMYVHAHDTRERVYKIMRRRVAIFTREYRKFIVIALSAREPTLRFFLAIAALPNGGSISRQQQPAALMEIDSFDEK